MRAFALIFLAIALGALAGWGLDGSLQLAAAGASFGALMLAACPRTTA